MAWTNKSLKYIYIYFLCSTRERGNAAPSFKDWSVKEEAALAKLEDEPVSIKETALGCIKGQHKHKLLATYCAMSDMEKQVFLQELAGEATKEGISEQEEGKREGDKNDNCTKGDMENNILVLHITTGVKKSI